MNRQEFIEKLVLLYEDFTEENIEVRKEAYELVLDEELDYSIVFKKLLENYESFRFAPPPATIFKIYENKYDAETERQIAKVKQIEEERRKRYGW